jgi:ubiquinone/menaquinone biosynthesis C-methylase UbiE
VSCTPLHLLRFKGQQDQLVLLQKMLDEKYIEGFVPTPLHVVRQLVSKAGIHAGMSVLEPSAGKGNIADQLKNAGANVSVVEADPILQQFLTLKGHQLVGNDFLKLEGPAFDRIVMNPPFDGRQDVQHLLHAYELLKPGGRLVAIMSENSFLVKQSDSKFYKALVHDFQEWLDSIGATTEKLPANTFINTERPTPIDTRVVVINKPLTEGREGFEKIKTTFQEYWNFLTQRRMNRS